MKEYIRMRDDHKKSLKSIKQQILALLLRQGYKYADGKNHWTMKHVKWIRFLRMTGLMKETLDEYLVTYEYLTAKIDYRHTTGTQGNKVKDKKKEVIINFSNPLEPEIVTDPFNMGTYNFGTNVITHAVRDVVPYWLWGNSPADSGYVYLWDRIVGAD